MIIYLSPILLLFPRTISISYSPSLPSHHIYSLFSSSCFLYSISVNRFRISFSSFFTFISWFQMFPALPVLPSYHILPLSQRTASSTQPWLTEAPFTRPSDGGPRLILPPPSWCGRGSLPPTSSLFQLLLSLPSPYSLILLHSALIAMLPPPPSSCSNTRKSKRRRHRVEHRDGICFRLRLDCREWDEGLRWGRARWWVAVVHPDAVETLIVV